MRIAGQTKLGYYPTPTEQTRLISNWLKQTAAPSVFRLLDTLRRSGRGPRGIALAQGGGETYGIELSDVRSEEAKKAPAFRPHTVSNMRFDARRLSASS